MVWGGRGLELLSYSIELFKAMGWDDLTERENGWRKRKEQDALP